MPPFRADHVGSLLRPPELRQARDDFAAGQISADELRSIEDAAITEVVRAQEEVGLQSATDGEFRRASWHMDFIYQLGGVSQADQRMHVQFFNEDGTIEFDPPALHIGEPVHLRETIFKDAFSYLQSQVTTATPKLTIPSPSMVHYRGGRAAIDERVYPDLDGFWTDLSAAYAEEVAQLAALGCTVPAARRHQPGLPQRPEAARDDRVDGRRCRAPARAVHQADQRGDRGPARGHDGHHAHVPGQLPLVVGRLGWLRLRGRGAVLAAGGRRVLPGVRRRTLGRLRAVALRAEGQAGRARPRDDEEGPAGGQGHTQAADRGGQPVRRPRPAVPVAAVRLLVHSGGQRR